MIASATRLVLVAHDRSMISRDCSTWNGGMLSNLYDIIGDHTNWSSHVSRAIWVGVKRKHTAAFRMVRLGRSEHESSQV